MPFGHNDRPGEKLFFFLRAKRGTHSKCPVKILIQFSSVVFEITFYAVDTLFTTRLFLEAKKV